MPTTRSQTKSTSLKVRKKPSSAVRGLEVSDVRRYLNLIRKYIEDETHDDQGLDIKKPIGDFSMSIEEFCFEFILGTYNKKKSNKNKES